MGSLGRGTAGRDGAVSMLAVEVPWYSCSGRVAVGGRLVGTVTASTASRSKEEEGRQPTGWTMWSLEGARKPEEIGYCVASGIVDPGRGARLKRDVAGELGPVLSMAECQNTRSDVVRAERLSWAGCGRVAWRGAASFVCLLCLFACLLACLSARLLTRSLVRRSLAHRFAAVTSCRGGGARRRQSSRRRSSEVQIASQHIASHRSTAPHSTVPLPAGRIDRLHVR